MKLVKRIAVGLVAALVLALVGITFYLGDLLGSAIERGGSYALGVDTRVGMARLAPLRSAFHLRGLSIANPAGFESDYFLRLGKARLEVDLGTLREETLVVPVITLDDVDVVLERSGGKTNVDAILANLKRFESKDSGKQAGDGKKLVVTDLVVTDITARVELAAALGQKAVLPLVIPEIRLHDVGQGRSLSMAELSDIVVKAVLASVAKNGAGALPSAVLSNLNRNLASLTRLPGKLSTQMGKQVTDRLQGGVDQAGETGRAAVEEAGKAVGEGAEKALRGLGGLLKRKEKE